MTQPIIFLDIDGVLTNVATKYRHGDPDCVASLNRITEATGAAIVVSSSWRGHANIAGILAGWGVTGKVIGITPSLSHSRDDGLHVAVERGFEIFTWLCDWREQHGDFPFVILDDDADMGKLLSKLVRTDTQLGLQDADVDKAIALLGASVARREGKL